MEERRRAEHVVEQLRLEGIPYRVMSVLYLVGQGSPGPLKLDGTLRFLSGLDSLALVGQGSFVAGGPLMAALPALGIHGALVSLGVSEAEAKRYESRVLGGRILLSVHCAGEEQVDRAKNVFDRYDAEDVSSAPELQVAPDTPTLRDINAPPSRP
jgi:hypothetical protein